MTKLRFIHTADIHLGSFLHVGGLSLPPEVEEAIETATLEGFRRVCDLAISHKVNFVVISGDLYDNEARSVRAINFFLEQCKRLGEANIRVYLIAGNHDPLGQKKDIFRMPDNVKVLDGSRPEICELRDDNNIPVARIIGQSYTSRWEQDKLHLRYEVPDSNIWNIALLHTQLEASKSNYIPCSLSELKDNRNIHYWALGHIHQFSILNQSRPVIAYPGIPQGRDFGEQGRGGCLLVELDPLEGEKVSFIPTAPIIYKRIEVDIDRDPDNMPEDLTDLEDMLVELGRDLLKANGDQDDHPVGGYIVEWILKGRGDIHDKLKDQEQELMENLTDILRNKPQFSHKPFLWTNSIILRTKPSVDYYNLMKDSPIVKELDNIIEGCLKDDTIRKKLMKELGEIWRGNGDYESSDETLFHMDRSTLEEILLKARQQIIEKLVERRE
jgi:exonuclease SbcD